MSNKASRLGAPRGVAGLRVVLPQPSPKQTQQRPTAQAVRLVPCLIAPASSPRIGLQEDLTCWALLIYTQAPDGLWSCRVAGIGATDEVYKIVTMDRTKVANWLRHLPDPSDVETQIARYEQTLLMQAFPEDAESGKYEF